MDGKPQWAVMLMAAEACRHVAEHVADGNARECCGFLAGSSVDGTAWVHGVLACRNSGGSRQAFRIGEAEALRCRRQAAAKGMRLLALYHSHPGGDPGLSITDGAALAHADCAWLVVPMIGSAAAPTVAWRVYLPPAGRPLAFAVCA